MNLDRYNYVAGNNYHNYTFYSEGPKGRIKKTVIYTRISDDPVAYNLAFGDEDDKTGLLTILSQPITKTVILFWLLLLQR